MGELQQQKMILLSDEPWSIANNSKTFTNGIKSIINNLALYKPSDIYLISNFEKHHGCNGIKI